MAKSPSHTTSALSLIVKELKLIFKVTNIIVQVLLLGYYGLTIYANIDRPILMPLYCVLAGVSLIAFVVELVLSNKKDENEDAQKKKARKLNRKARKIFFGILKYITRITILVIVVVNLSQHGGTDLDIITTCLSAILIIANIIVDILVTLVERYITIIRIGFMSDMQGNGIVPSLVRKFTKDFIDYNNALGDLTDNEKKMLNNIHTEVENRQVNKPSKPSRLDVIKEFRKRVFKSKSKKDGKRN